MEVPTHAARMSVPHGSRRLACTLGAHMLFAATAFAQVDTAVPADAQAGDVPRYTVELIVFRYDESVPSGNEVFAPVEPPADFVPELSDETFGPALRDDEPVVYGDDRSATAGGTVLRDPDAAREPATMDDARVAEPLQDPLDPEAYDAPPARKRIELQLLAGQQPRMNEIHQTLVNLDAYHPIMRAAWTQTTPPKQQAPAIHLQSLGTAPAGLDGSITLYSGRFVHLVVDLALDAAGQAGAAAATDRLADRGGERRQNRYGRDDRGFPRPPVRYRISEDRIMRAGDVRYFDHPKFGIIAHVTEVEDDAEDDEEAGEPVTREAVAGSN